MIIISLFIWGKLLSISLMRICWWGIRCLTHCFLFSFTIGGQVQRWNIVCLTPMVLLENQVRGLYQVQAQQRLAKVAVINPKKTLQSKPFLILSVADTVMHFYGVYSSFKRLPSKKMVIMEWRIKIHFVWKRGGGFIWKDVIVSSARRIFLILYERCLAHWCVVLTIVLMIWSQN